MGGICSTNGEKKNMYERLVGKPKKKSPLGRSTRRWVDNNTIYVKEMGWGGMDWIDVAEGGDWWKWTFVFHDILGSS
jgi:hypothetical protein